MADNLQMRAEAYAFRQLVAHLQERPEVQNIDIMNLGGFCRNCLSKWMHAGAAKEGLSMSYDEACEHVYGMPYVDYKKKHQTPATAEQMELFKKSHGLHAKHEKVETTQPVVKPSSACCDVTDDSEPKPSLSVPAHTTPITLGILTVSDRASQGVYEDLSGPEIKKSVETYTAATGGFIVKKSLYKCVPDGADGISHAFTSFINDGADLILSTGGTGLSARDCTPEATRDFCTKMVPGITELIRKETSKKVPLSMLSRATAGIHNNTLIINLPGRPKAVRECLNVLLPILPHALTELSKPDSGLQ
eukprot:TRINITY_DN5167_c0_g3_i1.p1 TRINITY_DN5167_c0_g3~~TRINITY_DN5167_c0_g3_i1.p1  ORF type:complete len:305 (+),score=34.01 TRINITY_DN5167_c0_g3_i1:56-970(+)